MTKSEANSAILVLAGYLGVVEERLLHEKIQKISKNAMFYLTYQLKSTPHELVWNHVISLSGYKHTVQNHLKFDSHGKLIEKYDLEGLHIVSMTGNWKPYLKLYGCNDEQYECSSEGYLADIMDILGNKMNFTWEARGRKDNDWGVSPLSAPSNSSRIWGGILGDIVYGDYQICVR
jgi:hypothetical protein